MPSSRALPAAGGSPCTLFKLLLVFADRPADLEESHPYPGHEIPDTQFTASKGFPKSPVPTF